MFLYHYFLPAHFGKFPEYKCYFLWDLVLVFGDLALVLVVTKVSLITSAEVPSPTPGHG